MGLFKKDPQREAAQNMRDEAMKIRDQALAQTAAMAPMAQRAMDAMAHMDVGAMMAYGQLVQRIQTNGVDGKGVVADVRSLGATVSGMGEKLELAVNVTAGPGAPRTVTITQDVMGDVTTHAPGTEVPLRINANDPDEAMIWVTVPGGIPAAGTVPAPATAPAAGTDTIARLEKLGALRDSGAITAEEFAQQKARILGGS